MDGRQLLRALMLPPKESGQDWPISDSQPLVRGIVQGRDLYSQKTNMSERWIAVDKGDQCLNEDLVEGGGRYFRGNRLGIH